MMSILRQTRAKDQAILLLPVLLGITLARRGSDILLVKYNCFGERRFCETVLAKLIRYLDAFKGDYAGHQNVAYRYPTN